MDENVRKLIQLIRPIHRAIRPTAKNLFVGFRVNLGLNIPGPPRNKGSRKPGSRRH